MAKHNPRARAAILQALEDQLASPDSPEVKAELERLLRDGIEAQPAKEMMATILSFHIVSTLQGRAFDYAAYLDELRRLPEIDFDKKL